MKQVFGASSVVASICRRWSQAGHCQSHGPGNRTLLGTSHTGHEKATFMAMRRNWRQNFPGSQTLFGTPNCETLFRNPVGLAAKRSFARMRSHTEFGNEERVHGP